MAPLGRYSEADGVMRRPPLLLGAEVDDADAAAAVDAAAKDENALVLAAGKLKAAAEGFMAA
jgi:hypothetical protein